jgi:hypothetical protein
MTDRTGDATPSAPAVLILPDADEQAIAVQILIQTAGRLSRAIDSFVGWVLAGTGAFLGFLVSREIVTLTRHPPMRALYLGVILMVVQKYLAMLVLMAAEGGTIGRQAVVEHGELLRSRGKTFEMNVPAFLRYFLNGLWRPQRWLVYKFAVKPMLAGDLVAGARLIFGIAQVQTFIALGTVFLLLWIAAQMAI